MPELPEVQTVVDDLRAAGIEGRTVISVRISWSNTVRPLSPDEFRREVSGLQIETVWRRGKYIVFRMQPNTAAGVPSAGTPAAETAFLLTHLRMTGQYELCPHDDLQDPHDRVEFLLDDGRRLRFHDTRKFGRIIFTRRPRDILAKLGPEPLDPALTPAMFAAALRSRTRQIKALLLDQSFLAGLGNIYCDEALFAAGIHPLQKSSRITEEKAEELLLQIRTVLGQGLAKRGTSLGGGETNYISAGRRGENLAALQVYGRAGEACPHCGTRIEKIYVAQRGSHFCSHCQPPPEA
ncbi:MAG: bifunctional DNA-formamidopyrimidine glycosylase/DNA-(apurinic or apyrimidinic site) lyase [Spirochaetota bacterium]